MKHSYLFLILSLASLSLIIIPLPKKATDYLVQAYGTQPLASKHRKQVESIMRKMEITTPIDMRRANWKAKITFGRDNAFAMYDRYLFISDSFFDELNKKEQQFLIGHELSHIKLHHNSKQLTTLILLLLLTFFLYGQINRALKPRISRRFIRFPLSVFCLWILLIGRQMISATVSRVCERQADRESVRCLKCSKGGIKFFNRLEKANRIKPALNRFQKVMAPWVATHPSHQERIDYCNDYKTNKDKN